MLSDMPSSINLASISGRLLMIRQTATGDFTVTIAGRIMLKRPAVIPCASGGL